MKNKKIILAMAIMSLICSSITLPAAALPPNPNTQSAIDLSGDYSWDYTRDQYNGTTGAAITTGEYDYADMNASSFSEGVGDYTFIHTFAGDIEAWYLDEEHVDEIIQSYWFYFPTGYEDDTDNITIIVHLGVAGTAFLSYVWFMNFSCYMDYHWTNLTHPDSTDNLVENDPVNYIDDGYSISTTIPDTAFDADQEWIGAITIATVGDLTSGVIDFWPEYNGTGDTGRNLLADRAAAQPGFQVIVDLFDEVFGMGEDPEIEPDDDVDDDNADDDSGGDSAGGSTTTTTSEQSIIASIQTFFADPLKMFLLIILIVICLGIAQTRFTHTAAYSRSKVRARRRYK